MQKQLIKKEKFTSIQEAQAGLTQILRDAEDEGSFYRVLRNNKPVGILLPNNVWESLLEDIEALNSANYIKSIENARSDKKRYSSKEVKKLLQI